MNPESFTLPPMSVVVMNNRVIDLSFISNPMLTTSKMSQKMTIFAKRYTVSKQKWEDREIEDM